MLPPGDKALPLRYRLAPFLAAGSGAVTRLTGAGGKGFQAVILHHVPVEQYEALRTFLKLVQRDHGFLTPEEAAQRLTQTAPGSPRGGQGYPCLITFDDGFDSALPVARDILTDFAIKAVFFVCPGLVDLPQDEQPATVRRNIFRGAMPYRDAPTLMGWNDLRDLIDLGHTIGAHGAYHLRLSELTIAQARAEIVGAGEHLAQQLGRFPEWYAYAFGDIGALSRPTLEIIRKHYRFCRTGIRGSNDPDNVPGIVNAQEISLSAPSDLHRAILNSALDLRYVLARRTIRNFTRSDQ